jgi:hypothetical protein
MILQIVPTKDRGGGSGKKTRSKACEHFRCEFREAVVLLPREMEARWGRQTVPAWIAFCRDCAHVKISFFALDVGGRERPWTLREVRTALRVMRPKGRAA